MSTFKLTVTYAAGHSQDHPGLSDDQAVQGAGAFMRDLVGLGGTGITRLVVEVERPKQPSEAEVALDRMTRDGASYIGDGPFGA